MEPRLNYKFIYYKFLFLSTNNWQVIFFAFIFYHDLFFEICLLESLVVKQVILHFDIMRHNRRIVNSRINRGNAINATTITNDFYPRIR